jgi:hemoglobin
MLRFLPVGGPDQTGGVDGEAVSDVLAATLARVWAERSPRDDVLGRLAATGEITHATLSRLQRDLDLLQLATAATPAQGEKSVQTLVRLLVAYATTHGPRPPVPGWAGLRDDRALAVLFHPPPRTPRKDSTMPSQAPAAQAPRPGISLYEALGQITGLPPAQAVTVAVEQLYDRIFADPALLRAFRPPLASVDFTQPEHRPRLEAHMRAFLVVALGGPDKYQGRGIADAHARLRITDEQFSQVIEHAVQTLDNLGVPPEAVGAVGAKLAPLRPHIVTA